MDYKRITTILLIVVVLATTFESKFNSLINDFRSSAILKEDMLREHIQVSDNFINSVALHGNMFFQQSESRESAYYRLLKYNAETNSYDLDALGSTKDKDPFGNITGSGTIPEKGIAKDEINLALQYYSFFHNFYEKYPDIAWLYYTSENNFISMYPWIASKDFSYTNRLKTVPFYKSANPINDPERKSVWTPVYLDEAGKGLMVTLSKPIYKGDKFLGVVSLDLTNSYLSKIISSSYEGYLIDNTDMVLASSKNEKSQHSVTRLNSLLRISDEDFRKMKALKNNNVQRIGSNYIFAFNFDGAPWTMIYLVPVINIAGEAAASTLPILIICILFFLSLNQIRRRILSEDLLKQEKDLLKTTLVSINEGIIVTDQSGKITLMNKIAEEYTGWSNDEAYGQDFNKVFNNVNILTQEKGPDPVRSVLDTCRAIKSGKEIGLLSKDGSENYILTSAAGILTDNQKLTGVIVSFRDVTKEYEQEKEIETFLNMNLDMLCVADKKGYFHQINKRFEDILGYKSEELKGKNVLSYMHEEDIPAARDFLDNRLNTVTGFTSRYRCKDGSYKYLEWHTQPSIGKYNYFSARDVTEKVMNEDKLRTIANKDELTGLYNRYFLDSIIDEQMEKADHYNEPISMILLDIDHFKNVNDTWGHPAGDDFLKMISQIIAKNIRSSDILVRFGGEEFIILMPQTSLDGAISTANKIRTAIENNNHPITGIQTASLGVAQRKSAETFASWYQRVDEALYKAKQAGRNRVIAAE